ncbi:glycoside hydrolase family 1 protein [Enterococcus faecium]|uniref:glycoside hydrolase family 1 protein n=1 Tax=Enterococcus faecium TaxID=1352 RepID=UPI002414D106|nr:glycoside hydrolase family 1 protein [Enterococcus faecium]EJC3739947.1 glycoside hydrolase family 1 protein [Enterococcus faecium]EKY8176946.1 glycoside hydrolase family 1 protein [Enterococcus faecium]MDG4568381.1 glycoside hydrolase family 1 protein [Enterococcus faecium]MDG4572388.1 glycoside hydrolase family 1 protein [Enterococcus faecium]MDT2316156.1 glycoside hydrolase family 1 protein [Enterococcus faecium]
MRFPTDFLWGASTSAYQTEGAWDADGKAPSVQDMKEIPDGTSDFKVAVDHYHRFEEDVRLFKELGLKAYRFSISWSRVMSNGKVNPKGLEFYKKLIALLKENEIEPIVTVFHFDLPYEIHEKGGWENRATIQAFADYCQLLFDTFGQEVNYWQTINEQNVMALAGSIIGTSNKSMKEKFQENHHMLVAQALVTKNYHDGNYPGKIGPAPNIASVYAASDKPEDQLAAMNMSALRNWLFLDAAVYGVYNHNAWNILSKINACPEVTEEDKKIMLEGTCDYIAFNYYNTMTVSAYYQKENKIDQQSGFGIPDFFQTTTNPHLPMTEFGWPIDPEGFRYTLNEIYSRYRLPLLITENGIGAKDQLTEDGKIHDKYRIDYLKQHIQQMYLAMEDGVEVIGYCPWSAIDLISTHEGIEKRYGFIYVDRTDDSLNTLDRYKKDSFYWYQKLIAENGLNEEE